MVFFFFGPLYREISDYKNLGGKVSFCIVKLIDDFIELQVKCTGTTTCQLKL